MNQLVGDRAAAVPAISVPFFIRGKVVEGCDVTHSSRDTGTTFLTPSLDIDAIARPRSEPAPCADMKVSQIIDFLAAVGKELTLSNPYLKAAWENTLPFATLPPSVIARCYEDIGELFGRRWLEITVEADIGAAALDGWREVPSMNGRQSWVKACPPRLVHVLAGNVPVVAAMTIANGALTKGIHLLKMPSNDIFTATAILRTMAEMDPNHPVTRSFSAVYWKGGDERVENILYRPQFFDKIVAWGGESAVRHVQKYVGPGFQLVAWDPKTSISMIGREAFESEASLAEAAALAATDSSVMNQDACVASRYHYVEGAPEQVDRYCEMLERELGRERMYNSACGLPTPWDIRNEVDVLRHLEPDFRVWGDYSGAGLVVRSSEPLTFFPDCRTVNVVAVPSLEDAMKFANVATQTVGIYPSARKAALRDRLADFGVQYVICLGEALSLAPGLPHDGCYELNQLVRWVADRGPASAPPH